MHPLTASPTPRQETSPDIYRPRGIYAPAIWAIIWVMRAAICAQVMSAYIFGRHAPKPAADVPHFFHRNRQLRRARASCLRRARRCARKHGRVNPADYTPRAYAHFAYVDMMPKHWSIGRFMESYVRDNNLSRVDVYGMDSAHRITGFDAAGMASGMFANIRARLSASCSLSAMSFAGLSDPAPP